jgi:hypothetical protein
MLTSSQMRKETAHLDALIARVKGSGEGDLLVEHLQTAHAYLHGAMPMECAHNLELARNASNTLSAKPLRDEVNETVDDLVKALNSSEMTHAEVPRPVSGRVATVTAKGLSEFFQGDDTSFGIFYPKKHVVAVFTSFEQAQAGYKALSAAGFRLWEIVAVSGAEVASFLEEIRFHRALWDELVAEISRLLDTEINLVEHYALWAKYGYGFLVVRSPDSDAAERIAGILDPLDPMAMHWFMSGYIRHLTEGN